MQKPLPSSGRTEYWGKTVPMQSPTPVRARVPMPPTPPMPLAARAHLSVLQTQELGRQRWRRNSDRDHRDHHWRSQCKQQRTRWLRRHRGFLILRRMAVLVASQHRQRLPPLPAAIPPRLRLTLSAVTGLRRRRPALAAQEAAPRRRRMASPMPGPSTSQPACEAAVVAARRPAPALPARVPA